MSDQPMNDSTFGRMFILMILLMTVLTVILVVLAVAASSEVNERLDARSEIENSGDLAERIAPVGQLAVDIGGTRLAALPTATTGAELAVLSGEQAYQQSCTACHSTGVPGSPQLGDATAWSERLSKGIETLYSNAINGIGAMPAKGGGALGDDSVKAAVDYILEQSQ